MVTRWILPSLAAYVVTSTSAVADVGPYVGATVGSNNVETSFGDFVRDFDQHDSGWSAFAGLRLTDSLGIEASFNNFGDFFEESVLGQRTASIDAELTGFDVFAVLSVPLGPAALFGKAGVVFWDTEATAIVRSPFAPVARIDGDDDGTDFAFGAGVEFVLTPALSLRGEYEWFDIEETAEVSFVSVGLSYRF